MHCRILYLMAQLGPGGSERQLCYLLGAMDRKRYRPAVAVWNFCEREKYVAPLRTLGVPLHPLPSNLSGIGKLLALRRLIGELKPEVVNSYASYLNFAAHWAVLGRRVVAVGSVRSDLTRARKEAGWCLGSLSSRWPPHQIYNNLEACQRARRRRGFFVPGRLSLVRNGVCLQQFHPTPLSPSHRVCIAGVGSLLPVKRWDRLLRAAQELKRRGIDFLIRICGDGPLHKSLIQVAQTLGVADRVEFSGHCDDIPGLLADASFLVHPSDSEGCPNAVMEAMACGRPVVATDAGDVPHLVEDGKTGFVVRRGDDARLVDCIERLINDQELCRRMGQASRQKAEREFGLDRLVKETLTVYRSAGWTDS